MQSATIYQQKINDLTLQLGQTDRQLKQLSLARLLSFAGILFFGIQYFRSDFGILWIAGAILMAVVFIWSLARYQRSKDRQALLDALLTLNKKELRVVTEQVADFENGEEFTDDQHDFTGDLDVFGPSSLFQYLNRTGTLTGKHFLADWLRKPMQQATDIQAMQGAVRKLSGQLDFRQLFTANAQLAKEGADDVKEIRLWKEAPLEFLHRKALRITAYVMPALMLAAIVYYAVSGNYVPVLIGMFVNWMILLANVKKVNAQHVLLSNKEQLLKKFAALLRMIKEADWKGVPWLEARQHTAAEADRSLHQLASVSNMLDQRLNLLVCFVLNTLMLYDIHCIFRLERWKAQRRLDMDVWLETIAQVETADSLATFAFNHPAYTYPSISTQTGITAKALGHPLIPEAECVVNDCRIGNGEQFHIITGSNMSGKSTFLRSVGVNWLLAMTGAPVCAEEFACNPLRIMTSMRIRDSIARHTSYFQAELLRLQHIIQVLKSGQEVFIILDEILKGTNSEDKLAGSRELVRHFLQYRCTGMIATHDLELGAMEQEYPEQVRNWCFESSLDHGRLHFDYKMRPGVARNKNATFLMKQMEII
ncbi:MAG: MutS-related protein [Chitinophaga sp.]